jgi:large subunit ribosomal protein L25
VLPKGSALVSDPDLLVVAISVPAATIAAEGDEAEAAEETTEAAAE